MRRQIPDVVALEREATAFPWTEKMYTDSLDAGYWGGGLCEGTQLLGVAMVSSGVGESHLLNMCIGLDQQGRGLGRLLLRGACRRALEMGADKMFLEFAPAMVARSVFTDPLAFDRSGFARITTRES